MKMEQDEYIEFAANKALGLAQYAGRPPGSEDLTQAIWEDIMSKLPWRAGEKFLDIGCGCGDLLEYVLRQTLNDGVHATLLDAPQVLERARENFLGLMDSDAHLFLPGSFPQSLGFDTKFDVILIYSVIHLLKDPVPFILRAAEHLRPGGRLLVGDIPNLSKKGRFLSSPQGRAFEARYRRCRPEELPQYPDHHAFVRANAHEVPFLDDQFMAKVFLALRDLGLHAYILNQPQGLTFGRTREDLLVIRPC